MEEGLRGDWGRRRRFFKRGDLRLLILELLQERPRHGYDLIRALEDRFGGVHAPSPGTIYPTLDVLADLGLITGADDEGRRVFTLTPAGQELLWEQGMAIASIRQRMDEWWAPGTREQLRSVHQELKGIHRAVAGGGGHVGNEGLDRIKSIVINARREVEKVLDENEAAIPMADSSQRGGLV